MPKPEFPIYIPSKGRHDSRMTIRALEAMNVPYFVIVEEEQYADYAAVINKNNILVLDKSYQREYETCDDLGDNKSKGPGPARNFAWDHAVSSGYSWHWVMDDNIKSFYRMNHNKRIKVNTGAIFKAIEDFVLRYKNIGMAGPNYTMFAMTERAEKQPPFRMNTRIYSCNFIRNDLPFRWRGRYNEDTILSLDMLKAGWCTIQFYAFLQGKIRTQILSGGNTEEFYSKEGTLPKSQMLVNIHPDVSRVIWKFGRWHHVVNYRSFKKNKLIRKKDLNISESVNEYGMKLAKCGEAKASKASR